MAERSQAFVTCPLFSYRKPLAFHAEGLRRKSFHPRVTRASIDGPDSSGQTRSVSSKEQPAEKTKAEEIAALLGQNKETMQASAEKVRTEVAADTRTKYAYALASTLISTSLFLVQKFDPNANINLLHVLQQTSAPISVIGNNNMPTIVEFSADWCENCKYMAKGVSRLRKQYDSQINFVVVDGENPSNAEILEKFGVDGIPQFSFLTKDGTNVGNLIGRIPEKILGEDLDALIAEKSLPHAGMNVEELFPPQPLF